jgi:hypothetical protein
MLSFYHPFHFCSRISTQFSPETLLQEELPACIVIEEKESKVWVKPLPWDSNFFGFASGQIIYAELLTLQDTRQVLRKSQHELGFSHLWGSFPAEDAKSYRLFLQAGGYPITTRLHYSLDLKPFKYTAKKKVRRAAPKEAAQLGHCAASAINPHDRTHADPALQHRASLYLQTYAENAVMGFTDAVLVPKANDLMPAFFALNYQKADWERWGISLGKFVISAVSQAGKGTYSLLAEGAAQNLCTKKATHAWFNTQAANRAVIRTWQKQGAALGGVFHLAGYADSTILSPQASGTMS